MPKQLQDLGLSEKEARVYLAALELGRTTAEKLAKHAKVNRSTTYVQLESLMKKGLMSTNEEGKKTYFAPESPELLKRLLLIEREEVAVHERQLVELLPILLRQFEGAGERPVARFFPGKEGIASVREEVLTAKDKQLYVLFSAEKMSKIFSNKEIADYTTRRIATGMHSKAIYTDRSYFDTIDFDPLTEYGFIANLPITIDIRIFDDKTAIFSLKGTLFAMVIESKQIASSMKLLFDFLWSQAEKAKKNGKKK